MTAWRWESYGSHGISGMPGGSAAKPSQAPCIVVESSRAVSESPSFVRPYASRLPKTKGTSSVCGVPRRLTMRSSFDQRRR